ncbi:hypothetical protein [Hymenobacter sp. BT559]|uniref:hypothetical protein n=1 Tax=Hymenobacter sp. BT559 TaxID=2795729 RepID=UPI0018EB8689|nr:hypothetical protein [Hymenobacter sp. BT559]MBJ6142822.1 hypothetical protein [Hymenobacter sp. BT559]
MLRQQKYAPSARLGSRGATSTAPAVRTPPAIAVFLYRKPFHFSRIAHDEQATLDANFWGADAADTRRLAWYK